MAQRLGQSEGKWKAPPSQPDEGLGVPHLGQPERTWHQQLEVLWDGTGYSSLL